jgi:hypothetical protein
MRTAGHIVDLRVGGRCVQRGEHPDREQTTGDPLSWYTKFSAHRPAPPGAAAVDIDVTF